MERLGNEDKKIADGSKHIYLARIIRLGLFVSFIIMSSGFGLPPTDLLSDFGIPYLWVLGFSMMLLFSLPLFLVRNHKVKIDSWYLKLFLLFLGVILVSVIWSIAIYKYDPIETLKASREYLGYLTFFIFLILFQNNKQNYKKFFLYIYYVSFFLIIIYIIQFVTGTQIFSGHSTEYRYQGQEIIRNIPQLFHLFFIYLWYNLSAWMSGRKLLRGGKLFIVLAYCAALFTLTRGIYLATIFSTVLVILFYFKRKEVKLQKLAAILAVVLLLPLFFIADNPFSQRIGEISSNLTEEGSDSTFFFRLAILGERATIAMEKNPVWGLGFYHPENEAELNLLFGPWEPDRNSPALWSSDIAWANIIYQMGLTGVVSLSLLFIAFIAHFPRIIRKHKFLADDLIGLSVYVELIRQMILMWIGAVFTYNTQNIAMLLAFYTYWYQHGIKTRSVMVGNEGFKSIPALRPMGNNQHA